MNLTQLKQFVDSLETHAGAVTAANANEAGYWKRAYTAAETLAGATTTANDNTAGHILRTVKALEAKAGTSGVGENDSYEGHLERIADALEAFEAPVTGTIDHRIVTAAGVAELYGPELLTGQSDTTGWIAVGTTVLSNQAGPKIRVLGDGGVNGGYRYPVLQVASTYRFKGSMYPHQGDRARFVISDGVASIIYLNGVHGTSINVEFVAQASPGQITLEAANGVAYVTAGEYAEFNNISLRKKLT